MSLFIFFFLVYKIKGMFFYLFYKSTILDSSNSILKNENRSIKVLLYGSIIYVVLHMSLFLGGKEALLYNFKIYFWVLLGLDISILLLTNVMNRDGSINFLFTEKVNNSNYRVNLDNKATREVNEINDGNDLNKRYVPDNLNTENYNMSIHKGEKKKKDKRDKTKEKSVSFNLKKDDTNKYSQGISKDLYKKSTPLNQLPNYSNENNSGFNINTNYSSSSSSESESEFNTDIDFNSFERSLSI